MTDPLVTVICLCYNQERYVSEALLSVLNQTYANIQLIVVDDASVDGSVEEIKKLIGDLDVPLIINDENLGNCRSFNKGLALAQGEYVIDLAADDVLIKTRIEKGVEEFKSHSADFGVNFTDAEYIDEYSRLIRTHYERDDFGGLNEVVPEGDIYAQLVERYFVCTPSMMIKKTVFDELGGYNENLSFEDFDFWVRSSRQYKYMYTDELLVRKRILVDSMSSKKFLDKNFMKSVLTVCQKARELNQSKSEDKSLERRIRYEMRQSMIYGHYDLAEEFFRIYTQLRPGWIRRFLFWTGTRIQPDLSFLKRYQK